MIDEIYHNNVRYLGNLLGEIIREQEGDETFNLIENVRRLSELIEDMMMLMLLKLSTKY